MKNKKAQLKTEKLKISSLQLPKYLNCRGQLKTEKLKISSLQLPKYLNCRGQLKIQQMAFMLLAVTLFFALVGMFVLVVKFSDLKESATELEEKNALLLVTKLANSPEFACGTSFETRRINCIDADKVMMLKKNIDKYAGFWGVSNIEIRKIYPKSEDKICSLSNYPDCDVIRIREKEMSAEFSGFVSLCRKENNPSYGGVYDKCELARIMVSYEGK